jgi:hypothetical protein
VRGGWGDARRDGSELRHGRERGAVGSVPVGEPEPEAGARTEARRRNAGLGYFFLGVSSSTSFFTVMALSSFSGSGVGLAPLAAGARRLGL